MEKHADGFWYLTPEEEKDFSRKMRKKGYKIWKGRLHWFMLKGKQEVGFGHHDTTKNWLIKFMSPEEMKNPGAVKW